jgi:hypothetical protein
MVDSSFKFLLKEKDLKVVLNLSPSQDFFPCLSADRLSINLNLFLKSTHPASYE